MFSKWPLTVLVMMFHLNYDFHCIVICAGHLWVCLSDVSRDRTSGEGWPSQLLYSPMKNIIGKENI